MAVAFQFITEGAHHLAMAQIATFAHIDIAPHLLEWCVGPHALYAFNGGFHCKKRHNLHQTADGNRQQRQHTHQDNIAFNDAVITKPAEHLPILLLFRRDGMGRGKARRGFRGFPFSDGLP